VPVLFLIILFYIPLLLSLLYIPLKNQPPKKKVKNHNSFDVYSAFCCFSNYFGNSFNRVSIMTRRQETVLMSELTRDSEVSYNAMPVASAFIWIIAHQLIAWTN